MILAVFNAPRKKVAIALKHPVAKKQISEVSSVIMSRLFPSFPIFLASIVLYRFLNEINLFNSSA